MSFLLKKKEKNTNLLLTATWCHFIKQNADNYETGRSGPFRNCKQKPSPRTSQEGALQQSPGLGILPSSAYLHLTTTWMFFPFSSFFFADEFG